MVATGAEFIPFAAATKNPARMLWNARQIARLIESENVDLVHARSRAPAWSAMIAARRMGIPFITTYHGAYSENGRVKNAYNSVMARGDVVIANSRYTANLIRSRYATPEQKVRVIYRGVDGAAFDPARVSDSDVASLRQTWNIGAHQKIILQAARLTAWKGHGVVIAAAKHLNDQGQLNGAVFVLAGDTQGRDGYRQKLERDIEAAGLKNHMRLPGHVENMPVAYRAAQVAVIASTEPEAFGRTATEAQVMGCPVIATNIGAPPETVLTEGRGEMTGWLVAPGDAIALSKAVNEAMCLGQAEHAALGRRARAHVLEAFTLDAMRLQTLAIYDEVLNTELATQYKRGRRETSP